VINEIQNSGRRHFECIIFVHFGQNFIHLRQLAAELLLFVQKSKMDFVMLDHPRSPFVHLKFPFKFCASAYFSRYHDLKILQIWLKMPIQAPQNNVYGEF